MTLPTDPAARHREVADRFSALVRGTTDWVSPSPVLGWTARDVVDHLVTWLPGLLESGSDVVLPSAPTAQEDPVAAWESQAAAVQSVLDDPATQRRTLTNPHLGTLPLAEAIDRFYTTDVFMHTWDLARATGQDDTLDPDLCEELVTGMQPIDELLRGSGQYGPAVPVPADADPQTRLIGFIGRDPAWQPPRPPGAAASGG